MSWKIIGKSVAGSSHFASGRTCEDALAYSLTKGNDAKEVLLACASDGAGSAKYAKEASELVTKRSVELLSTHINENKNICEADILLLVETVYDELNHLATANNESLSEYSCTFLGCVLYESCAIFFQIGDGAIIRNDGNDGYATIWWPHNGEYINTTSFITDDHNFPNLKIMLLNESINEVALLTDGLQNLVLNNETSTVHQPFFNGLYKWLRFANREEEIDILNNKLSEYLTSEAINSRTDDDKTLLLASRV